MKNKTLGSKLFTILNITILVILAVLCLLPLLNVLAISFSSASAAATGNIKLWPVDFTLASYKYVLSKKEFLTALWVSVKRLFLGVSVNMILTILAAYPLSKDKTRFRHRSIYTWFFIITILFNGGLIPGYMTMKTYGLLDSIWALVLPSAVPVFNIILLMNFFRELPIEIEEAAFIDGAGPWTSLWKLYLPLSKPALATLVLFAAVAHWNSWFDGLLFMNNPNHYPLQSYLQTVIINRDMSVMSASTLKELAAISDRTAKAAQVFIGAVPILLVYPFLQRYFTKGLVLGSVKG
ncbi:carbohydrate ABC transporter permease [Clostridium sp. SYSU_GA19001]|nr:carbohydrate ABC transporter permease [Clostridium caldaquaticum]MCM8711525.1 carbohydrate ABC transporter permease [Clostridium caldaquaticum]